MLKERTQERQIMIEKKVVNPKDGPYHKGNQELPKVFQKFDWSKT